MTTTWPNHLLTHRTDDQLPKELIALAEVEVVMAKAPLTIRVPDMIVTTTELFESNPARIAAVDVDYELSGEHTGTATLDVAGHPVTLDLESLVRRLTARVLHARAHVVHRARVVTRAAPRGARADLWPSTGWDSRTVSRHLPGVTCSTPTGGMFCWLQFPAGTDTGALLPRALEHGVGFVPGAAFAVDRPLLSAARCCHASHPEPVIVEAVRRLAATGT